MALEDASVIGGETVLQRIEGNAWSATLTLKNDPREKEPYRFHYHDMTIGDYTDMGYRDFEMLIDAKLAINDWVDVVMDQLISNGSITVEAKRTITPVFRRLERVDHNHLNREAF